VQLLLLYSVLLVNITATWGPCELFVYPRTSYFSYRTKYSVEVAGGGGGGILNSPL